jgi:hypothetical protein
VSSTPKVDVVPCNLFTPNAGSFGGSNDVACSGATGALATVDGRTVAWNEPSSSSAPKSSADVTYASPVAAASVTGLRVLVAYDGDDATEPLWYWYAHNVSGSWDLIGNSSFAHNWSTTQTAFPIANPASYVDAQNRITIRFTTLTSTNSAELDRMVVEVTH